MEIEFSPFAKIARLTRQMIVTEKIDGTNASIYIGEDGSFLTASRNRWITPENDNAGFAKWATEHKDELINLGVGHHFGEWWGQGIQRGYGLTEKRFSLFNVSRWEDEEVRPKCCGVVPILYRGMFDTKVVDDLVAHLAIHGSYAVDGFMKPEGVVVYHVASGIMFKKTIEKDETPKSLLEQEQK